MTHCRAFLCKRGAVCHAQRQGVAWEDKCAVVFADSKHQHLFGEAAQNVVVPHASPFITHLPPFLS